MLFRSEVDGEMVEDWGDNVSDMVDEYGRYHVTGSITLYARWSEGDFPIKFNSNGGTAVRNTDALKKGETLDADTTQRLDYYTTSREGFVFGGWYLESATHEDGTYDPSVQPDGTVGKFYGESGKDMLPRVVPSEPENYQTYVARWVPENLYGPSQWGTSDVWWQIDNTGLLSIWTDRKSVV